MSLQVLGPKPYFWQWDVGQKLVVNNTECGEVHFCNGTDDCAIIVPIKTMEDGARVVKVPDILLQTATPIKAYLFQRHEDGAETVTKYVVQVLARSRPADYVYTEEEFRSWIGLEERVAVLEKGGGGGGGGGNVNITINGDGPDENGNFIINTVSDVEIAQLNAALT